MTKKEMMNLVAVAMNKMTVDQCEAVLAITKTFVDIDIKEAETKAKSAEEKPVKKQSSSTKKTGNGFFRKTPKDIKMWLKGEVAKAKNITTVKWQFENKTVPVNGFKTKKDADKFIKTLPTTRTLAERLAFTGMKGDEKYAPKGDFDGVYEAVKVIDGYAIVAKWA